MPRTAAQQTRPWRVYRTGSVRLTILEAHPWHTPLGTMDHRGAGWYEQSAAPHCPRCRQEAHGDAAIQTGGDEAH